LTYEARHGFRWAFAAFERAGGGAERIVQVRCQNEGEAGDDGDHETQGLEAKEGQAASRPEQIVARLKAMQS
jgi:hypothetical protein